MATVCISMVKDERDVIEAFVRCMAPEVDLLMIADNGSTDGTRDVLEEMADDFPLEVLDDPEVGYYQSRKMSKLASLAHRYGADWVIPADADERWYSPHGRIADVLAEQTAAVASADLYHHVATAEDPDTGSHLERIGWRRKDKAPLPKVACRARVPVTIHQGNHGADYATGTIDGLLVVRHFPYRTAEQMIHKARNGAAAYAATDLPEEQGKHWRDYGRLSDEQITETFHTWYWSADPANDLSLIFDPCPV